jgi:hypothetical protein
MSNHRKEQEECRQPFHHQSLDLTYLKYNPCADAGAGDGGTKKGKGLHI